ncbi:hypothetical protein ACI782_21685 [Geodermatophilus sp. SYSU D00703]
MSALTPDCDPDLSTCGSPVRVGPLPGDRGGGGGRSTAVLLALLVASVLVATGEAVPGVLSLLAVGVALLSALVLGRRAGRLARRAALAVAASAHGVAAGWRSRPAG